MSREINRTIYTVQNLHKYDKKKYKKNKINIEKEIRKHNEAFKPQVITTPIRSSRESKRNIE